MVFNLITYLQEARLVGIIAVFLLIFAIVYGILLKTKIFKDNKLNGAIAIIIGLIASNINFSSGCLSEIFKFFLISLVIILVAYLLIGLFLDSKNKKIKYVFLGGLLLGIIVFFNISEACSFGISLKFKVAWPLIISLLILVGIIYSIIKKSKKKEKDDDKEDDDEEDEPDVSH